LLKERLNKVAVYWLAKHTGLICLKMNFMIVSGKTSSDSAAFGFPLQIVELWIRDLSRSFGKSKPALSEEVFPDTIMKFIFRQIKPVCFASQ
jgi:hypothetical protein